MSVSLRSLRSRTGPGVLDLLEEGFHLLRGLPVTAWAVYLAVVLPFAWLFLFFWLTLIHEAGSESRLGEWAALLTCAFLVLRVGQCWFFQALVARRSAEPLPRWTVGRLSRVVREQAFWAGAGAVLLPLAAIATLPFPHVYSLFNYKLARSGRAREEGGPDTRGAALLARRSGAEDWKTLLVLALFAALVLANWMSLFQLGPQLLKSFFGIETVFTRSSLGAAYAAMVPVALVLTYLVIDPLLKVTYALRWFYLRSRQTGEDLRVELRELPPVRRRGESSTAVRLVGTVLLGMLAALVSAPETRAAGDGPERAPVVAEAEAFAEASERVLARQRYAWRLPPEERAKAPQMKRPGLIERFFRWLEELFGRNPSPPPSSPEPEGRGDGALFGGLLQTLLFVLLGLLAVLALALLVRASRQAVEPGVAEDLDEGPDDEAVDLADESLTAAALPVSEWVLLARRHLDEGDFRRALRAYFLAQLAELAGRGFLRLARHKSNRDYHREMLRRAALLGEMPGAFGENVRLFEQAWYGNAPADRALISRFEDNLRRMEVNV
ncbi:MAG: DUF4129 domain-containing protein [Opitutales bacterium]